MNNTNNITNKAPPLVRSVTSDADKYRWIRSNRGNYAIVAALNNSDRDADFDANIESAIRRTAPGHSYESDLEESSSPSGLVYPSIVN